MIRVLRGASYSVDSPDVVAILHVVVQEAPAWQTVEVRETIAGLNLITWSDSDVLSATGAITPSAYDAIRAPTS